MTRRQWRTVSFALAGALLFLTLHLCFVLTWTRFFNPNAWPGYEGSATAGLIEPWFVNSPASLWLTRAAFFILAFAIAASTPGRVAVAGLACFLGAGAACAATWATTRAHTVDWGWLGFIIYPFRLLLPIVIGTALAEIVRRRRTQQLGERTR